MKMIITPNQKIGRLLIEKEAQHRSRGGDKQWHVVCDCGTRTVMLDSNLKRPVKTEKSCGCIKRKHGKWRMRSYEVWIGMMKRCYNKKAVSYERYGARGITVCDRWHDFEAFIEDMGEKPDGLSIERIDNNLPYSPENCRWATAREQSLNRRSNVFITHNGVTKTAIEWSADTGIPHATILARIGKLRWDAISAITTPVTKRKIIDKDSLIRALSYAGWNQSIAAIALGTNRGRIAKLIKEYQIVVQRKVAT